MQTTKYGYQQSIEVPKPIVFTAKTLQFLSPKLAAKFAGKLFRTPMKFPLPKREFSMDTDSVQKTILVPTVNKEARIYHYGTGEKKILLAHGWSGRGTQLVKIAEAFVKMGYSTISFDAPAHGKTKDKVTDLSEFLETILYINEKYGPFEAGVGHSLGGMSLLNAIKKGLPLQKLVTIGSGDIVCHIMYDFIQKIGLKSTTGDEMITNFEKKHGYAVNSYSASLAAKGVHIPVLVVHDEEDLDVPVSAAHNIRQNLSNAVLLITKGYGHKKILGNPETISKITDFIIN